MNSTILQTHCQKDKLTLENPEYEKLVFQYTFGELEKDLGASDITTNTIFSMDKEMTGEILAKQGGILSGIQELEYFLKGEQVEFLKKDGDVLNGSPKNPEKILKLTGSIFDLMKMERVVLNLIGRMSGVSTFTKKFVDEAKKGNPEILVTPTRKTLWGLLDKKACVLGGGGTHRLSLSDAILIKHNHIRAFGSDLQLPLRKVLNSTFEAGAVNTLFVEIEVNTGPYGIEAARIFSDMKKKGYPLPCFVMFDNLSPKNISQALETIKKGLPSGELADGIFFEASGSITLENIQEFAKTGVDIISVGGITHAAPMFDFTLRLLIP